MADKGPFLNLGMVGREPFPSLVTMISEPIGIEQDLQQEDRISSIKIDQGLQQEVGHFLQ